MHSKRLSPSRKDRDLPAGRSCNRGFTLVELLVAVLIGSILLLALSEVVSGALSARRVTSGLHDINADARFAMARMVRAVSRTRFLVLPLADNPATNWREHVREQTVPASPPEGSSTLATAVLALTLPDDIDLNADGIADTDDDGDGRIDEDLPSDSNHDGAPGILLIDDDGDGSVDEGSGVSDDESDPADDDPVNGLDDDGDGSVDEDSGTDMNSDGCPGICGVDDDGDGTVDEGSLGDDDENNGTTEDWFNTLVFYLSSGSLIERIPVPWDENTSGGVTGADFVAATIASNVTRFRVERVADGGSSAQLVDLTLELTDPDSGETVSLQTTVRVGGAL